MKTITTCLSVLFIISQFTEPVFSQACCSGGVPISNNIGSRLVADKTLSFRLSYDANILRTYYTGTEKLEDQNIERFSQSGFLQAIYGINNKLSINSVFSVVNHQVSLTGGSSGKTTSSGIGDVVLLFQYQAVSTLKNTLFLSLGGKIPIGESELKDESGIALAADLQPGTGSWDAIANIGYIRQGIFNQAISFSANFIGKINTYADRFNGLQKYKYGDDYQLLTGITHNFAMKKLLIEPGLHFRLWHRTEDKVDDFMFPNTGGSWVYLVPGIDLRTIVPGITFSFSSEIPVYQNLKGTQLSTTVRFSVGLQYDIRFKKDSNVK